jgi:hypothetical protein
LGIRVSVLWRNSSVKPCSDALATLNMPSGVLSYLEMQAWAWFAHFSLYVLNLTLSLTVSSSISVSDLGVFVLYYYSSEYYVVHCYYLCYWFVWTLWTMNCSFSFLSVL